ncbi:unnamed protein product, partial [marine sediment metagenome]
LKYLLRGAGKGEKLFAERDWPVEERNDKELVMELMEHRPLFGRYIFGGIKVFQPIVQ